MSAIFPEGAEGGLISLIEEGDMIKIDIPARRLELLVDNELIEQRRKTWQGPPKRKVGGYLKRYAKMVSSACEGRYLKIRNQDYMIREKTNEKVYLKPLHISMSVKI